jgi:hypothetical protein
VSNISGRLTSIFPHISTAMPASGFDGFIWTNLCDVRRKTEWFYVMYCGTNTGWGCQGTGRCGQNLDLRRSDKLMDKLTQ